MTLLNFSTPEYPTSPHGTFCRVSAVNQSWITGTYPLFVLLCTDSFVFCNGICRLGCALSTVLWDCSPQLKRQLHSVQLSHSRIPLPLTMQGIWSSGRKTLFLLSEQLWKKNHTLRKNRSCSPVRRDSKRHQVPPYIVKWSRNAGTSKNYYESSTTTN